MIAATFNVWVGQHPVKLHRRLKEMVEDTEGPAVVATQESKRYHWTIPGYTRVGGSGDSNLLFVHKRKAKLRRIKYIKTKGPWWKGPRHGIWHPPHKYPAAKVRTEDGVAWFVSVHRVPGGNPRNRLAEADALVKFCNKPWRKNVVLLGDWNERDNDADLNALAKQIGADIRLRGIDGALTRGLKGRTRRLPKKYGSDTHRPVVLTLKEA